METGYGLHTNSVYLSKVDLMHVRYVNKELVFHRRPPLDLKRPRRSLNLRTYSRRTESILAMVVWTSVQDAKGYPK